MGSWLRTHDWSRKAPSSAEKKHIAFPLHLKPVVPICKFTSIYAKSNSRHGLFYQRTLSALNYSSLVPQGLSVKFYPDAICIDLRGLLLMGVGGKKAHFLLWAGSAAVVVSFINKWQIGSEEGLVKGFMPHRAVVGCEQSLRSSDTL